MSVFAKVCMTEVNSCGSDIKALRSLDGMGWDGWMNENETNECLECVYRYICVYYKFRTRSVRKTEVSRCEFDPNIVQHLPSNISIISYSNGLIITEHHPPFD